MDSVSWQESLKVEEGNRRESESQRRSKVNDVIGGLSLTSLLVKREEESKEARNMDNL